MPVKAAPRLRAKHRFLGFARKKPLPGYGQNGDFCDLPVKCSPRLRAKWRFLGYARNQREHRKFVSKRGVAQGKEGGRSAFFKITAVYGHIDENGAFVRKSS